MMGRRDFPDTVPPPEPWYTVTLSEVVIYNVDIKAETYSKQPVVQI